MITETDKYTVGMAVNIFENGLAIGEGIVRKVNEEDQVLEIESLRSKHCGAVKFAFVPHRIPAVEGWHIFLQNPSGDPDDPCISLWGTIYTFEPI